MNECTTRITPNTLVINKSIVRTHQTSPLAICLQIFHCNLNSLLLHRSQAPTPQGQQGLSPQYSPRFWGESIVSPQYLLDYRPMCIDNTCINFEGHFL